MTIEGIKTVLAEAETSGNSVFKVTLGSNTQFTTVTGFNETGGILSVCDDPVLGSRQQILAGEIASMKSISSVELASALNRLISVFAC